MAELFLIWAGSVETELIDKFLRRCETHSQRVSLAPPRTPLKLSLLHSIVFHIALKDGVEIKKEQDIQLNWIKTDRSTNSTNCIKK